MIVTRSATPPITLPAMVAISEGVASLSPEGSEEVPSEEPVVEPAEDVSEEYCCGGAVELVGVAE